jgi:hypothetical protein
MRALIMGWLVLLLRFGCTPVLPSAAPSPAPVPSAAQPAAIGRGGSAYAHSGLEALRTALREVKPEEALKRWAQDGVNIPDAGVAAGCAATPAPMPVLVCHFGPVVTRPVAQAILWHDGQFWHAQLYPQTPSEMHRQREETFAGNGCQIGCSSAIVQVRQGIDERRPELLVVVDLGVAAGRRAHEVHLLALVDDAWQVVWAPAGDWHYGDATVKLTTKGITGFTVRNSSWLRSDLLSGYLQETAAGDQRRFVERWVRKGSAFILQDRAEEPSPYSSLVRLIHYLSQGADEKAEALIAPHLPVDDVRQALAQRPKRQEWSVIRWGDDGFLLDRRRTGKPDLRVRFARKDGQWILTDLWPIDR